MKVKTNELIGPTLDWAVAKCEGQEVDTPNGTPYFLVIVDKNVFGEKRVAHPDYGGVLYAPSTDWAQGGPIIEREEITIVRCDNAYGVDEHGYCDSNLPIPVWAATTGHHSLYEGYDEPEPSLSQYESELTYGPTPLIAAMRCHVASKLGDEVDVPEELK